MNDKGDPTSRQDFMCPSTPKPTAQAEGQPTQRAMSEAERRIAAEQALANTRIEGHVPTPEFLADFDAFIQGTLTLDDVRERSTERARALDQAARTQASLQKTEI
jgi:Antitoxin VbhA